MIIDDSLNMTTIHYLDKILGKTFDDQAAAFYAKEENIPNPENGFNKTALINFYLLGQKIPVVYGFYALGEELVQSKHVQRNFRLLLIVLLLSLLVHPVLFLIIFSLATLLYFAPVVTKSLVDEQVNLHLNTVDKEHPVIKNFRTWVQGRYGFNIKAKQVSNLFFTNTGKADGQYWSFKKGGMQMNELFLVQATQEDIDHLEFRIRLTKGYAAEFVNEAPVVSKRTTFGYRDTY